MSFGSVSQMIQDILQRAPNPGEAEAYQALIDGGSSTLQGIANTLVASQEAVDLVLPVLRFYQGVYGRVPDKGGAAYWVGVYRDIAGQDDPASTTQNEALVILARPFVDPLITPEFVSRYGPAPSSYTGPEWQTYATNFIDKLYLNVLQRAADAGGLAYWTGQFLAKFEELRTAYLPSGRTEAEAALEARAIYLEQFTNSQEMKDSTAPWVNGFLTGAAHDPDPANLYTGSLFNDAPTAVADSYNATEDQMLVVNVGSGVLINDIDPDFAQPLTASVVTAPAVGVLNLASGGSFTYTPPANFNGPVTFTYRTSDTITQSAPQSVTINVAPANDLPVLSVVGNSVFNTLNDRPSLAAWNLTDADGESQTYTVTLTVTDPAWGAIQGSVGSYNPTTGVYTIADLGLAATNAAIDSLTYVPLQARNSGIVIGATDSEGAAATNRGMSLIFQNIYSMGATTGFNEAEGNGTRLASFTVNRVEGSGGVSIVYTLTGGPGFTQADVGNIIRPGFAPTPMLLDTPLVVGFASGELSRTVTFEIIGDTHFERNETFTVTLSNPPSNSTIQGASAQGTILNDDRNIDLANLGTAGFRIAGAAGSDNSGYSVASAGDINNDGFADLIIGAYAADFSGRSNAGSSYVVFGKATGFANIDLANPGSAGFQINGAATVDESGISVASAGDFNNDGFADLIIGAWQADPLGRNDAGSSYVVFGKATGFANIDLANLGSAGFRIDGAAVGDTSGFSIASAGDVNNDGFADLIIGAFNADPAGRTNAGSSYVVFGKGTGFTNIDLGNLGNDGFRIDGAAENNSSGYSVASAGDINNDGFADLIIGAWQADPLGRNDAGSSYVVFGKATGFANLDLANLGSAGFQIDGAVANGFSGWSVASAGDINNDGFDDLIIGAQSANVPGRSFAGSSYVVFGKASGFANLDLANLGNAGFRIIGAAANDQSGVSVASAGDVNNDGFADLIIGAYAADPSGRSSAGSSYVVFGKATGFTDIDLANLGSAGFRIDGVAAGDLNGSSVASAGDVNNDGFADLITGAFSADPSGRTNAGSSYVIFGGDYWGQ